MYASKRKGAKEQREDGEEIKKWRANIEVDESVKTRLKWKDRKELRHREERGRRRDKEVD